MSHIAIWYRKCGVPNIKIKGEKWIQVQEKKISTYLSIYIPSLSLTPLLYLHTQYHSPLTSTLLLFPLNPFCLLLFYPAPLSLTHKPPLLSLNKIQERRKNLYKQKAFTYLGLNHFIITPKTARHIAVLQKRSQSVYQYKIWNVIYLDAYKNV